MYKGQHFVQLLGKLPEFRSKKYFYSLIGLIIFIPSLFLSQGLRPVSETHASEFFEIKPGDSFGGIVERLSERNLIRSEVSFKTLALVRGSAGKLQPGLYKLSPSFSAAKTLDILSRGAEEVLVTIHEGLSVYEVDEILSSKEVLPAGALIKFNEDNHIEGRLFPDTYRLLTNSRVEDVVKIFNKNFEEKIAPLLAVDPENADTNLILASMVEKEVPTYEDQQLVAGIIKKRLKSGMPIQIDATLCYMKKKAASGPEKCYPLTAIDIETDSPYNTYQNKGLPPGPIASPGVSAVRAVLESKASPYWFYLSDPDTRETHFSETLEEHNYKISLHLR